MLVSFGDLGRHCFDSFMHWIKRCREQAGSKVALCNRRVMSRDLKSVQFLKRGFSGFIYETTWSTWYGMERSGRYARKDLPGVDSKVFEDEAARLVDLDHPNVVKSYCWTVDKVGCSLVMEFVNDDLASVVRERKAVMKRRSLHPKDLHEIDVVAANSPFELVEAMYIMWHIAAAMEYLHSMKVAHGDLRPNNVMVDLDPGRMIVKVVDFGLIESKKRTTLVSKRAKFLQILEWKAPELSKELVDSLHVTSDEYPWTCTSEDSDDFEKLRMADRYSFAILCTYIMGGKVSYPKSSLTELQQKLLSGTLKPKLPSTCPPHLKRLIESCWSRSAPEKRTDFHKFKEELEAIIRQETTGGHSLKHPEVGGIMHRWMENIQQMGIKNTLYLTYPLATLYLAGRHITVYRTILVDEFLPIKNAELPISKSAELLPSPSTRSPPRPSLEPSARLTSEPSPSESHRFFTARLCTELVQSESWSELSESVKLDFNHNSARMDNVETFASLKERYGEISWDNTDDIGLCIGEKFAEGGQTELFFARWLGQAEDRIVLKMYKEGTSLRHLLSTMSMDAILQEARALKEGKSSNLERCHIFGVILLEDGRFAFAMERYWGDLQKLIDRRMIQNARGAPPFTVVVAKRIMMDIAKGMQGLHDYDVVHRDLKASNILIKPHVQPHQFHPEEDAFSCLVADYETNIGVVGTGFFRPPEILLACKERTVSQHPELFTKAIDVYGFAMTCYEILTGHFPFEDHARYDFDFVLDGARPKLPSNIHPAMKSLVSRCWHQEPSARPTFVEILDELKNMIIVEEGESFF